MPTLHIEHAITDYGTWKAAFDHFADFRRQAGVRHYRIEHPLDDAETIVIDLDLDFDTAAEAVRFQEDLRTKVWPSRDLAPALVGTPHTVILDTVEEKTVTG